ncbi:sigma-70 family RNA polymerase sigma factor [Mycolicibacterium sp. Dal123E01]|uniref:sigma-70 family RNA polymerase sigma factor n=1 Tax=Mycolicibacterium sp. Dal123E01 TaxID=3457578 RepID=UPI00403ED8B4
MAALDVNPIPIQLASTDRANPTRSGQHASPAMQSLLLKRLFARALQLTSNCSDAEDLLQETTLKAYLAFSSYEPGTNLAAWLSRIMTNTMIDTYRRRLRRPEERLVGDFLNLHFVPDDRHPSCGRSAEAEVVDQLPESHTLAALQSLNDGDRTVLYYADVEGYGYSQIAEVLGIPIGTVASRLHTARRRLRLQLADTTKRHRPP